MNSQIITTLAAVIGLLVAMWTMLSNFDKRNGDRFDALQKQIEATKETLRAEMGQMRAELRGEMHDMRAELKAEIKEVAQVIK
jgi:uncharacterized protein YPO0396